jgi:hypothetical protein
MSVHCGVARTTKSAKPCVFCGATGSLSTEHLVPKWVRKALQISEPVREFSGTTYVGAAETLSVVFHEVCVRRNSGWMETLETVTRPVLGPLLLGAAPGTSRVLDPHQQAILATWAVKTSLLMALSKFRRRNAWRGGNGAQGRQPAAARGHRVSLLASSRCRAQRCDSAERLAWDEDQHCEYYLGKLHLAGQR